MDFSIIFYSTSFVLIVALLYLLTWFWPPDSPWSPWWKTSAPAARAAARFAKITSSDIVYELGSGDGEFAITVAEDFDTKIVGVEIDPYRYFLSRLRLKFHSRARSKVTLIKKNYFHVDISPATVVYFYLVPRAIERLVPKLKKELKKGARVVSYRYEVPGLTQIGFDKKNKLYIYKI